MVRPFVVIFKEETPLLVLVEADAKDELSAIVRQLRKQGYDATPAGYSEVTENMVACSIDVPDDEEDEEEDCYPLEECLVEFATEVEDIYAKVEVTREEEKGSGPRLV